MKGRILLLEGDRAVEINLKSGATLVGRGPSCHVRLADPSSSREHCRIEARPGGHALVDLGSHNGTLVNGQPVHEVPLRWGDVIQIGQARLVFIPAFEADDTTGLRIARRRSEGNETVSIRTADLRPDLVRHSPELAEYLQGLFELSRGLGRPADEEALLGRLREMLLRRFRVRRCEIATAAIERSGFDVEAAKTALDAGEVRMDRLPDGRIELYAPIQGAGAAVGVLFLSNEGSDAEFGESLMNAVGVAARQVGLALESYRYVGGLRLERDEGRAEWSLVGESRALREVRRLIERFAAADATVLIRGESGVGKEVVAREIHARGPRAEGPFVPLNCAAVPEALAESELFGHERGAFTGATAARRGLFEQAEDGTVFLDEIGELSDAMQAKLLRILENRTFMRIGGAVERRTNARTIAATHRDLETAVEEGRFRRDLYYRLRVLEIRIPPLRERPEDVATLAEHFRSKLAPRVNPAVRGFAPDALAALARQPWPGNVRELRNVVERALIVAAGSLMARGDLLLSDAPAPSLSLDQLEREHIARVLRIAGGNKSEAARLLGINRSTLYEKLEAMGLSENPTPRAKEAR
jgi:DNA-binding NtrC family response regulator